MSSRPVACSENGTRGVRKHVMSCVLIVTDPHSDELTAGVLVKRICVAPGVSDCVR
jgi:hypothetical protein